MNRFARAINILDVDVPYSEIVAEQFSEYWNKSAAEACHKPNDPASRG